MRSGNNDELILPPPSKNWGGVLIAKEKKKWLAVDKKAVKLLQTHSLAIENGDDLRGSLIHRVNVTWHLCWVNQGQNRWGDVKAISLENDSRFMGGGQRTSRG